MNRYLFKDPHTTVKASLIITILFFLLGVGETRYFILAEDLDKEFYNDYLDSLPNEKTLQEKKLVHNLFKVIKRIIPREDTINGPSFVKHMKRKNITYKRVNRRSVFVRGIFKELRYIKNTPFMWIAKIGPYMLFVTFKADPRLFIQAEYQTVTVVKKSSKNSHPAQ